MALEAGYLRVALNYAKDIKNCDFFGRQDPYCLVRLGDREVKSTVCRGAGRNPVWGGESFHFTVTSETTLELTLMDEDRGMTDDLIGTAAIDLTSVRARGSSVVQAPVSKGKRVDKSQGFIQVTLEFVPCAKPWTACTRGEGAVGATAAQCQGTPVEAVSPAAWSAYSCYDVSVAAPAMAAAQQPAYGYGYSSYPASVAALATPVGPDSQLYSSQSVH